MAIGSDEIIGKVKKLEQIEKQLKTWIREKNPNSWLETMRETYDLVDDASLLIRARGWKQGFSLAEQSEIKGRLATARDNIIGCSREMDRLLIKKVKRSRRKNADWVMR